MKVKGKRSKPYSILNGVFYRMLQRFYRMSTTILTLSKPYLWLSAALARAGRATRARARGARTHTYTHTLDERAGLTGRGGAR